MAVGVAFAAVFGVAGTLLLHRVEDHTIHSALLARLDVARDAVAADGHLLPDRTGAGLVQVLGPDGAVVDHSPGLTGVGPLVAPKDVVAAAPGGLRVKRALQQPDIDLAALAVPLRLQPGQTSGGKAGVLVVAVDAEGFTAAATDLFQLLVAGLALVVVTVGLLTWLLSGRALRSVTALTEQAETVSATDARQQLPTPGSDRELTRLVSALNRMLDRLREAHARELAFASDAGHRLRTPVATLRAEAELALRDPDPTQQREALQRVLGDADQLGTLIDRMLARNRAAGPDWAGLADGLRSARERWARSGELVGVTVQADLADPAVDGTMLVPDLAEVLDPLIDNAVRHAGRGGRVSVLLTSDGATAAVSAVLVEVTDDGPGVPPQIAERIFDAWVSSRDASVAGGLGLWLARERARDAGGDIRLIASTPGRTVFRVELPTRPAAGTGRV